jgi:hypothetical protein
VQVTDLEAKGAQDPRRTFDASAEVMGAERLAGARL